MIKKILFLVDSLFNQRDFERFGIELLMKNGFEVEVWDFTPFLQPDVYREVKVPDPVNFKNNFVFQTKQAALAMINKLTNDTFILSNIEYDFNNFFIYKAISRLKLPYAVIVANTMPFVRKEMEPALKTTFKRIKRIRPAKLRNFLFRLIPYKFLRINPAMFILAGGEKSIIPRYHNGKQTQVLWLHALDYDIYLKEKNNPSKTDPNTAVFLDEYIPFHPDYLYMKIEPYSYPQDYYPVLCRFFDFLEEKYNLKIIIAAHPRSCYESYPDYFNGRPVIRGKTAGLVKKSGLVIIHSSTSINFAVLFRKPIIFITTDSLKRSIEGPWIETMAGLFNKKPINISNSFEIDPRKEMIVDEVIYNDYRNAYIKRNGTEDMPFWKIVADRVKPLS